MLMACEEHTLGSKTSATAGVAAPRDDEAWWAHYWDDALDDPTCSSHVLELAACGGGRYITPQQATRLALHPHVTVEALAWCAISTWDDYETMCGFLTGSRKAGLDDIEPAEYDVCHALARASILGQAIVSLARVERSGWELSRQIRVLFQFEPLERG